MGVGIHAGAEGRSTAQVFHSSHPFRTLSHCTLIRIALLHRSPPLLRSVNLGQLSCRRRVPRPHSRHVELKATRRHTSHLSPLTLSPLTSRPPNSHPLTLSPSHPLTLSPSHPLTLSPSQSLTLSPLTLSPLTSHPLTLSPSHLLPLALPTLTLSVSHPLTLSPSHPLSLSPSHLLPSRLSPLTL